jgi:hypothetical protein
MPKTPPLITCIFCGDVDVPSSGEDWMPLWLAKKLAYFAEQRHPGVQPVYTEHKYSDADTFSKDMREGLPGQSADEARHRGKEPRGDKVPDVCITCNGGWMSRLEIAVKPIMVGFLSGTPKMLDPYDKLILATWTIKTCLANDASYENRYIPNELGTHRLYLTGIPLTCHHVSIGHEPNYDSEGARVEARLGRKATWLGSSDTFTTVHFSFQFEHLVIRAALNAFDDPFERRTGARLELGNDHHIEIWPLVGRRIWWPTEAALTPTGGAEEPVTDAADEPPVEPPDTLNKTP